ncbi:MAG: hypothetical protein AAGJ28_04585 [Pseudomonadota bacterium]
MRFCLVQAIDQNCLFITSAGKYDAGHVREMIRASSSLDFYKRRVAIIYDMRRVHFTLDRGAVQWLVTTLPDAPAHSDVAMIADTEIGYEMISLYADLRQHIPQATGAFRTMEEAVDWLAVPEMEAVPRQVDAILTSAFSRTALPNDAFQITIHKACGRDAVSPVSLTG